MQGTNKVSFKEYISDLIILSAAAFDPQEFIIKCFSCRKEYKQCMGGQPCLICPKCDNRFVKNG